MTKIAIVTDSTAYLPAETIANYGITVIPLSVVFGQESTEEDKFGTKEFYEKMRQHTELPTTSQPSMGQFLSIYETLAEEYESILSFHLSSGISGTFQTALSAARLIEDANVYPFDSEISCSAQGYYVIEAAKMVQDGKSVDEIFARMAEIKESLSAFFIVDDLNHLHRGGRLSSAQKLIGSALQIKPVLHFKDKVIVPFEKVRTHKRALKRVIELFGETASEEEPVTATIIHGNRREQAEKLHAELARKYPHVNYEIGIFGPVIGTHLGEGGLGITWYKH